MQMASLSTSNRMYVLLSQLISNMRRRAWTGDNDSSLLRNINLRSQLLLRKHPPAFHNLFSSQPKFIYDSIRPSWDHAMNLFAGFQNRVDPLTKITFDRELFKLRELAIDKQNEQIPDDDCLLLLAIFLAGARSMSQNECSYLLKQSKESLMSYYRGHFEHLLAQTGLFFIDSIKVFQAVMVYMVSHCNILRTRQTVNHF